MCENNQYAMSARSDWSVAGGDPASRAAGYGIPGVTVDGMDLSRRSTPPRAELIERARRGEGPAYLVCNTYRFHGHHAGDPLNYREKEEVERWRLQDPIERVNAGRDRARCRSAPTRSIALERSIERQIEDAVEFAKAAPSRPSTS